MTTKKTSSKPAKGKSPAQLIDARTEELGAWRAIDFREGDKVDAQALNALVRAAIRLNPSKASR